MAALPTTPKPEVFFPLGGFFTPHFSPLHQISVQRLIMSRQKASYLRAIAEYYLAHKLDYNFIAGLDEEALTHHLTNSRGGSLDSSDDSDVRPQSKVT